MSSMTGLSKLERTQKTGLKAQEKILKNSLSSLILLLLTGSRELSMTLKSGVLMPAMQSTHGQSMLWTMLESSWSTLSMIWENSLTKFGRISKQLLKISLNGVKTQARKSHKLEKILSTGSLNLMTILLPSENGQLRFTSRLKQQSVKQPKSSTNLVT